MSTPAGSRQVAIRFRMISPPVIRLMPANVSIPDEEPLLCYCEPGKGIRENITRWLTPDDLETALRFQSETRRQQWIETHALLNRQLAILTGDGRKIPSIARATGGKPFLSQPHSLFFNLSDTDGFALAAFSTNDIGIDVERIHDFRDADLVAGRFFSPTERTWIQNNNSRFFLIWTRKEAILKLTGVGLSDHLSETDTVSSSWNGDASLVAGEKQIPPSIHVYSFITGTHVVSVATHDQVKKWEANAQDFIPLLNQPNYVENINPQRN